MPEREASDDRDDRSDAIAAAAAGPLAERIFPFVRWWPMVNGRTTRDDLLAGLSGALVGLPQGVAFALLAGLPPEYGLYAAMIPPILSALFGSSLLMISGPTNAIAILLFASLSPMAAPGSADYIGLVLTVTFLTGVFQLAMGLARLGALVNFVSHTVISGFAAGAAVLIASTQIRSFFGIDVPSDASFLGIVRALFVQIGAINPYVSAVGVFTLAAGILCRRFVPKIPFMITATILGALFALLLNHLFGADVTRIETVGVLPSQLPPLSFPDLSLDTVRKTAPAALATTILALTLALSVSRGMAVRTGQHVDTNQEFVGQGLSNVVGSFFSSFPSAGSFNRTAANFTAGAKTPLASVYSSLILIGIVLLVAPLGRYLPMASVAAMLFLIAYGLIDVRNIRQILKTSKSESAVMLVTFFAALFLGLQTAIYIGVLLSLMLFLNKASRPGIRDVKPDPRATTFLLDADTGLPDCPQLKMLRINGSIFFGAAEHADNAMKEVDRARPEQTHLLIASSGINIVDISGAEMLAREARRRKKLGGGLYFHFMKDDVREFLRRGGYLKEIGEENLFMPTDDAIAAIYPKLDTEICRQCKVRIFKPCNVALPNGEPRVN